MSFGIGDGPVKYFTDIHCQENRILFILGEKTLVANLELHKNDVYSHTVEWQKTSKKLLTKE
jgi:hypothetical protein